MQPTPADESAKAEVGKDLARTAEPPQAERAAAQAGNDAVEIDEPQRRGWRFWRRKQR
jgi:hypothetical protein